MRFSIVIPVFKTERFLSRCLASLVAQTEGDFEVIVVDDASPGEAGGPTSVSAGTEPGPPCAEIVARYGDRFRYLRHEKNRSAFQARCTGVAAAQGDYIVPVDPDDYLLPETLAKLREVIERNKPDVVSYWIDCDDGRKIWQHWCRHPAGTETSTETLREIVEHKANYSIVSKAVRREIYLKAIAELQLTPDVYVNTSEDFLATLAVLLCSDRVSHLDYAGYRYFANPSSLTGARRSSESFRRACRETRLAHDAIRAMVVRVAPDAERQSYISDIIALSERFFCTEAMEGPVNQVRVLSRILFETFRPEVVGPAFAYGYAEIRGSRAYRLGRRLARLLRLGRG